MRLYLLLLLLLPLRGIAQSIAGSLRTAGGQPLPGATISLQKQGQSIALGYALSSGDGTFRLKAPAGDTLLVQASFTGYGTKDTLLVIEAEANLVLPPWILQPEVKGLDEIKVQARKPLFEVQPDKTVFNVSQSILGNGGQALELLQKTPGVLVDKDDNISMNGKTGVRIYIDGRPSPLSVQELAALLRTIPATDVEAIEVITNPSARYEAAGNAGIINIRLKKNKSFGTNGTVNAGWSVGIFPKYTAGLNLNHRNKKWNLFGSAGFQQSRNEGYLNLFRFQGDSLYDQRAQTLSASRGYTFKGGADLFLSPYQTLGLLVNGNTSHSQSNTFSRTPIAAQSNKQVAQILEARPEDRRERKGLNVNLNYRFADTTGRVLTLDADYGLYNVEGRAQVPNRYIDPQGTILSQFRFGNQTPVAIRFYSVQAAWEQKVGLGTLAVGWRSAAAATDNTFSFFQFNNNGPELDESRSNRFQYRETIHAGFVQLAGGKGKWKYQLGLRGEGTLSLGELESRNALADRRVERRYFNLFPSGGATYQLHKDHQLGLSFSRRIDRPSYQDLNPFENRLDELTYQKGNPFLRPQFTQTVEVKHSFRYKLNTSLSYSNVSDFFAAITDTVEGRRNFITQRNIATQRVYSLTSSLPFTITSWWSGFASVGVVHNRYRAQFEPGKEIRINVTVANLYQQHSFRLGKAWSAEVSSFYLSPYVWAGTYECRSIWNLDLGVQRKVLKDKGTVRLSATDIFQGMPWEGVSRLGSLQINASGGWESRLLRLNFSYRFGSSEVKAARQRTSGLEDLKGRVQ